MISYFLSIGSNLDDRCENLNKAIQYLAEEGCSILKASSIYETQPTDYIHQPWFLNQVIKISTVFDGRALLSTVKKIEKKIGREDTIPKGPRMIDIDILLNEMNIIKTEELIIPHPMLEKRNFVLIPLTEIAPDLVHPVLGKKIKELLLSSNDLSSVISFGPK